MEDRFCGTAKQHVFSTVKWALSCVKPDSPHNVVFAIAKGRLQHLDGIASHSTDQFYNIPFAYLLPYIKSSCWLTS